MAAGCLLAFTVAAPAPASQSSGSNAGDVWTDNVGQPAGPGHEQDTHLACQDINLWADGLSQSSGTYTIDGWPPSGSQEEDYSGTWSYDPSTGGDQVVSVISVSQLIATAQANGDAPKNNQGYHFKLNFVQNPQKHKTFWVDCAAGTSTPAGATNGSTSTSGSATTTSSATPSSSVKGVKVARHAKRHRKHKRRTARKHAALRRISRRPSRVSGFTG